MTESDVPDVFCPGTPKCLLLTRPRDTLRDLVLLELDLRFDEDYVCKKEKQINDKC